MTPTTKLEAVNIMLSSIGEQPVNSLASGLVDAELAEKILDATSREVQASGWNFNSDYNYKLSPTFEGEVLVPANTLKVDGVTQSYDTDIIMRGKKLYNRRTHSFNIGKTVEVNIVFLLEFEDLPEAARRYITLRGARIFQDRTVGSAELHGFQQNDEMMALVELKDSDADVSDYSIFDDYSTYSVIDRIGGKVF
jgi:hypothetical protein